MINSHGETPTTQDARLNQVVLECEEVGRLFCSLLGLKKSLLGFFKLRFLLLIEVGRREEY